MNQIILVGRLAKDPEITETEEGKKFSSITLAVQRPFKNIDGIYDTDFITCSLWNAIAENTTEYCKKGDVIGVKGRLQTNSFEDKEGNKKFSMDVIAEKITFLSSRTNNMSDKDMEHEDR